MCGAGKRAKYSLSRVFDFFTFLLINITLHLYIKFAVLLLLYYTRLVKRNVKGIA